MCFCPVTLYVAPNYHLLFHLRKSQEQGQWFWISNFLFAKEYRLSVRMLVKQYGPTILTPQPSLGFELKHKLEDSVVSIVVPQTTILLVDYLLL